ncbi:bifunctional N-acetylglucosamine-1-phosphate uridyltransferase/glucosamine-1-phosphate acetyltransferase [Pseudolabrys sp. Root1462]|uniref:bifunctional UDP-N-acetylglucosamine diphosphorylase/glucosamine-1-phosphate N-acetyltransferase GlmU n=1 Tax=Pseudolabrys sp. Root1462 TaxID=1736466 RepID=UPI00070386D6|nr:bifunctional UDP-N-acetylglucosamine diphosphorylase/glucosamine-1-phosphate N-acetyltransferase GlmU [Pseudolabrys sp. Root1462]KQZ01099.1 bifunctional N-acetylglucosamine-1-phosphate uridyltransferase/glucosamine-1-phosphate acetyltransferase [Pseudolabrys sp. Root1462]
MTPPIGHDRSCLAIVLAAGEGTRMRSSLAKVLHQVGHKTLVAHVLTAAMQAGGAQIAVVVGPGRDDVANEAKRVASQASIFEQRERLGTAHAVLAARKALEAGADDILVMFADTPLVRPETLLRLRAAIAGGAAVTALGFRPKDPAGYGRLVMKGDELIAIREDKDASDDERKIGLCNGGLMALAGPSALKILDRIGNSNAKGEYYLTDAVAIARELGLKATVIETDEDDVRGINNKAQLAEAEAVLQQRLRAQAMEAGVTMVAPETVFLSTDTKFGKDITIEPNVVFGPGVTVEDGAVIRSFSHLEGAVVGKGARVGPFARLRPGAKLGEDVHIGNFVEIKAAVIEDGAKANHLAYIGDARVGAKANVGAGTITCNYDGTNKFHTDIGAGAFIGTNSSLVAPVTIGAGAYIGSGSVITDDVPADALAIGRGRQVNKEGGAARLREMNEKKKKDRG